MNAQTALIAQHAGLAIAGPIGSFDAYLDRVSRIAVLDREQEQQHGADGQQRMQHAPPRMARGFPGMHFVGRGGDRGGGDRRVRSHQVRHEADGED